MEIGLILRITIIAARDIPFSSATLGSVIIKLLVINTKLIVNYF